ncbi:unnamed protein product [Chondrus crispus]|uniref:Glycosyltransferase 2-like domain-containing protein n=1 Tax=Chondrus crispus TaxID=2769 RepID=R7QC19_CHOCR|nr:unnamed protein product [Chondrus crispus]CDF36037.1 unnamed protein product [Chondrus crispus]|eukprot:XP_005715856.1 unnamed protein product [Chondrus crispus]
MAGLAACYRQATARTGVFQPFIHATVLTYALLLFLCCLLNLISPTWVSRNSPPPLALSAPALSTSPLSGTPFTAHHVDERAVSRCLSHGLLQDVTHDPIIDRLRAELNCGCRQPDVYEPHETPTVCAIVQSFNHQNNVERIAKALVANPAIQEIIVCEDGSTDASLDHWMEQLRDFKHFIVVSNNLHETRCYNRAMRMSSAEYFILMQDDDLPPDLPHADDADNMPAQLNWVTHALELFDADPKLGVLTGFIGQLWLKNGTGFEFGEQQSDHGGQRKGKTARIPFLSSRTLHPFMYAECAWIAPVFVRSEALHRVGGLDVGLFREKEPGVWQDCVLSYAAWTAGWRVGVYNAHFTRGVGGHGSTSSPAKAKMRDVVWRRAKQAVDIRYERQYIHEHILALNAATLMKRYGSEQGP